MEVVELVFEPRTVLSSCCSTRHTPASCSGGSLSDCNGLFPGPCVLQLSPVARAECTSALSLQLSNPSETLGGLNRTTQRRGLCGMDCDIPKPHVLPGSILSPADPTLPMGPAWTFPCVYLGGDTRMDLPFLEHHAEGFRFWGLT